MNGKMSIRHAVPGENNHISLGGFELYCVSGLLVDVKSPEYANVTLQLFTPLLFEGMAEIDIKLPDDDRAVELFKAALDNGGSVQDMATTFIKSLLQFGIDQMEGD